MIRDQELHYENVLFIVFKLLGFYTKVEYHTSEGRIDRLFLCREFHNMVHNHLAVHRFAHLYLVFLIVVDGLPEY